MDRLSRNAMLARQANMSYGKWKALQPIVPIEKKEVIPEGWKKCEYCGKIFKPNKGQKYCEIYCRQRANASTESARNKRRYYMKKYKERMKASG